MDHHQFDEDYWQNLERFVMAKMSGQVPVEATAGAASEAVHPTRDGHELKVDKEGKDIESDQ